MATHSLPKISVITPSFNQGRFLEETILSVIDSGYPNVEYILVDGGSRDETLDIIHRYANRIAWWVSEPDRGQSDAVNKGLGQATGELIGWLNSDDYYLPGALHAAADAYLKFPNAPFFFGDGWRIDESGVKKSDYFMGEKPVFNRQALFQGLNYILQPATFMNRQAMLQVGGLDAELHFPMDWDLYLRLAELGDPIAIPQPLATTREYASNKTSTGSFRRMEELRKVAEKYSGYPITPGVLCYYLDNLTNITRQYPELFSEEFQRELAGMWETTSGLLAKFGQRPDGVPTGVSSKASSTAPGRRIRGALGRLKRKIFSTGAG